MVSRPDALPILVAAAAAVTILAASEAASPGITAAVALGGLIGVSATARRMVRRATGPTPHTSSGVDGTEALERNERQLSEAQRLAHIGSWDWDVVADRFEWSDELRRIHGVGDPPLHLGGWLALAHPADRSRIQDTLDVAFRGRRAFVLDHRVVRPGGEVRLVRTSGDVLLDQTGHTARVVGASQDVTAAEETLAALRASEERYRTLFENNPQPMWVYETETLRFLSVNQAALSHYGYTREEFLAMTLLDIRPAEDAEAVRKSVAAAPQGLENAGIWRHRKKDGTLLDVEVSSHCIAYGGKSARLVLASDVTERRCLEAQLRQAQKMEAIGRLAGGVAHDFNNLLGVIIGYSELLKRTRTPEDAFHRHLSEILKAAERAAGLTRQLLTFSRAQVLKPKVLDLNSVVAEMEKMLRRLIGEDVRLIISPQLHLGRVKADPVQMEQVLMNLAVNARDAMPQGGTLVVETRNVVLDEAYVPAHHGARAGPHVLLAVSDNGCGMSAETMSHLFEPFFTTKEEGKGTGLGLATVYGIVKQSGGHLTAYSEPGHGTTFKVYFPCVEEADEAPRAIPPRKGVVGNETILLVEDEASLRGLIQELLSHVGYKILEAATPEEALALEEGHAGPIHLLLTDVVMPGMSGPCLARRLLARRREVKVLYMSGYTQEATGQHGLLDPEAQLVEKPFMAGSLLAAIQETLNGRAHAAAAAGPS